MRPLKQIAFVLGLALIVAGMGTLTFVLRNLVMALRHGGLAAAWNSRVVTVDGAGALILLVIGMALLRPQLKRRLSRLLVAAVVLVAVLMGVDAGYVG
jgi:hypothetical protein